MWVNFLRATPCQRTSSFGVLVSLGLGGAAQLKHRGFPDSRATPAPESRDSALVGELVADCGATPRRLFFN